MNNELRGSSMKKFTSVLTLLSASIALAACGGGGGGGDDAPAEQDAVIRGVINQTLPSAALPSLELPSVSLPSVEVAPLNDANEVIDVTLERAQEVSVMPLVDSNTGSSAVANIDVDINTGAVTATVTTTGFPAGEITMIHIHDGFAGNNGPILLGLTEGAPGVFSVTGTLTTGQVQDFLAGGLYFNLHTQSNPTGELRGQIVNAETAVIRTELQSQQEVLNDSLPVERDTSAVAYFTTALPIAVDNPVIANLQVSGFTPSLPGNPLGPVHVHSAPAGQNGPILFPLRESDATGAAVLSGGVFWTTLNNPTAPTDSEVADIRNATGFGNGNYYFNVHSDANSGGEVRGQIVPDGISIERVEIQTAQEIPEVTTPAVSDAPNGDFGGVGYVVTRDGTTATEFVGAQVQVIGFDPSLPAAPSPIHIHRGFAGATGGIDIFLADIDPIGTNVPANTFFNTATADADINIPAANFDATAFDRGENYINVHSAANPSGEIRAQITPAKSQAVRAVLQGSQEPQGVDATLNPEAAGVAYVTIDEASPTNPTVVVNATVTGFDADLSPNGTPSPQGPLHLHRGFAGINGSIAIGALQGIIEAASTNVADGPAAPGANTNIFLTPTPVLVNGFADSVAEDADNVLAGGLYINVHSAENPSGELRGQVITDNNAAFRGDLDSLQTLPPQTNLATGIGFITVTDLANGLFLSNVILNELDGIDFDTVSVNVGGGNNVLLQELTPNDAVNVENTLSHEERPVANLNGLLNGAYSFNASE